MLRTGRTLCQDSIRSGSFSIFLVGRSGDEPPRRLFSRLISSTIKSESYKNTLIILSLSYSSISFKDGPLCGRQNRSNMKLFAAACHGCAACIHTTSKVNSVRSRYIIAVQLCDFVNCVRFPHHLPFAICS